MKRKQRMGKLLLVHWNEAEARDLATALDLHGWIVSLWKPDLKLSDVKQNPPTAIVISLRRLPSHGREVADALWYTKWGRTIPIAFFDGAAEKIEAIRSKLPAAKYTSWKKLPGVLLEMATAGGCE